MSKVMKTMDGNEAAAYASYAFTEVAGIFPITPSSPMAEKLTTGRQTAKKIFSARLLTFWKCSRKRERQELFMVLLRLAH